jgi:hypothetical protein
MSRAPRRRDVERVDEERVALRRRAWHTAFDEFPELRCGTEANPKAGNHPCPWLVAAIVNLAVRGDGLKRGRVLAERRRLMTPAGRRVELESIEEKAA